MKNFSNAFIVIITALIFGFLAGVLGFIILSVNGFKLPFIGQLFFTDLGETRQVVINQPRNVVIEQDEQIKQIENDLLPTLINLYHQKGGTTVLSQAYTIEDILGQGFVLTADGWFITPAATVNNLKEKYSAIGYQNKKYLTDKLILDKTTNIVFGKFNASNLPVAKIGRSSDLTVGQTLVVVSQREQVEITHIKKIGYNFKTANNLILNSDNPQKEIFLDLNLNNDYNGAIVATLKGEIVALISDGHAVPVDYFSNIIAQVLDGKQITRAALGLSYVDLAQVEGLVDLADKGALIVAEPIKGTPTYGQVKNGDIIKKVNDTELSVYHGLADVINGYRMGDKVELTILRSGKELIAKVVLQ